MASIGPVRRSVRTFSGALIAGCAALLATALPAAAHEVPEEPAAEAEAEAAAEAEERLDEAEKAVGEAEAEVAEMTAEIERLRVEASGAAAEHEAARRRQTNQQRRLDVLNAARERERDRQSWLRDVIGQAVSSHYRDGAGSGDLARLMLAETPEQFLSEAALIGRGELSARQLLDEVNASENRLARVTALADAHSSLLNDLSVRQAELRAEVEAKLGRAGDRLAELEAVLAAAELDASRARAATGLYPDSDCPAVPREDAELAEPAVDAPWTAPLADYRLSASFGRAGERWADRHTGQDFAVPTGSEVRAIGSGVVVATACTEGGYGNSVVVEHEGGYYSQYAHLSLLEVEPGQAVGAGQRIGLSGSTGNSTGPHLHLEIRLTPQVGSAIDPVPWLRDHGVEL